MEEKDFTSESKNYVEYLTNVEQLQKKFIEKYGPKELKKLQGKELLDTMFQHDGQDGKDSMFNVLCSKETDCFVAHAVGSMNQTGVYYGTYKVNKTGNIIGPGWIDGFAKTIVEITQQDAEKKAKIIRNEIIGICNYIDENKGDPESVDYSKLSKMFNESSFKANAGYLKYFHIIYPCVIPPFFSKAWLENVTREVTDIQMHPNGKGSIETMGAIARYIKKIGINPFVFGEIVGQKVDKYGPFRQFCAKENISEKDTDHYVTIIKRINKKYDVDIDSLCDNETRFDSIKSKAINDVKGNDKKKDYDIALEKYLKYKKGIMIKNISPKMGNGINKAVDNELNTILYGPPGTGKTYNTVIYAVAICDEQKNYKEVKEWAEKDYDSVKEKYDELVNAGRIVFTTFHQSYGYEEFIEGIRPVMTSDEKKVDELKYRVEPGIFKAFCKTANEKCIVEKQELDADFTNIACEGNKEDVNQDEENNIEGQSEKDKPYVFIIDEINRGNISKIFGELITLIEDTKRYGRDEEASAILPYSGDRFSVPSNVFILGTMNTADHSIALMDTALRRRFSFVEMMPDTNILKNITVTDDGKTLDVSEMLDKINERIEFLYDREHTIGHAFFLKLKDMPDAERFNCLKGIFAKKIIPLLQEYFYEDYDKIRLILGDNVKKEINQFIKKDFKEPSNVFRGKPKLEKADGYSINKEAFEYIESYIEIMDPVQNKDTEATE